MSGSERNRVVDRFKNRRGIFHCLPDALPYLPDSQRHNIIWIDLSEHEGGSFAPSLEQVLGYSQSCCKVCTCYRRIMMKTVCIFIVRAHAYGAVWIEP